MNNLTQTWAQGDENGFWDIATEKLMVKAAARDLSICQCTKPEHAEWVASRLNLASKLEQLTYDFAMGKTDGEEIRSFVQSSLD